MSDPAPVEELELSVADRELRELEARARLPKTFSASLLGWVQNCMFAARLSKEHNYSGPEAHLGSAVHEVLATADTFALTQGRTTLEPEEVMVIADQVLARSSDLLDTPLTMAGYMTLMEMVSNWAGETVFPEAGSFDLWEVELPVRTEFMGHPLTGRIDKVVITGTHADIHDYKTGGWVPDDEEVAETHSQLPIYGWHIWKKYPWVQTVTCTEHYVRAGEPRTVHMGLGELAAIERFLAVTVTKAVTGLGQEHPDATPGDHCAICPNARLCPVPEVDRPASIQTEEDALDLAGELLVLDKRRKEVSGALQAHCKQDDHPGYIVVGEPPKQKKIGYHEGTERKLDKKGLAAATANGETVDMEDFYETVPTRKWAVRNLTPARGKRA